MKLKNLAIFSKNKDFILFNKKGEELYDTRFSGMLDSIIAKKYLDDEILEIRALIDRGRVFIPDEDYGYLGLYLDR